MRDNNMHKSTSIPTKLVTPCGMNCRLCRAYNRDKNPCSGYRGDDSRNPQYVVRCKIKTCEEAKHGKYKYCNECNKCPCKRLRQLDKRYRSKYGMSMLDNLDEIKQLGIRRFIANQKERWVCPECGRLLCVHKPQCLSCGFEWYENRTKY